MGGVVSPFLLEKDIEKAVVKYAKSKKILAYKLKSPNMRGVPDRMLIFMTGKVVFIEFKRYGKKLSHLQEKVMRHLLSQGAEAFVIDSIEEGKNLVDRLFEKYNEFPYDQNSEKKIINFKKYKDEKGGS